jgi:hypothetical protein
VLGIGRCIATVRVDTEAFLSSQAYELLERAIVERCQVLCFYQGHVREICPAILGHTDGQERTLAFQFAGSSSKGLLPGGQWKCLNVAEMSNVALRSGEWHGGASHRKRQECVKDVDIDVNPRSPYKPRRRLRR